MQAKPKLHQSLFNPRCAVDEKGFPVFEFLYVSDPSVDGEYLRSIIRAVNSHADLLAALKSAETVICSALDAAGYAELYPTKEEREEAYGKHVTIKQIRAAIARAEEV